ncbi:hypothetical protein FB446DRAFT_785198 [Lentinula raphanica]|nr:hypothetical protein FB446DRAFT_785198 [Lentinula raphanica]
MLSFTTNKTAITVLLLVLTLLSTAFNVVVWLKAGEVSRYSIFDYPQHDYEYGESYPVQAPGHFESTTMAFQNIDGEYPLTDDKKWASIIPPKGGFIRLGPAGASFSIAMYHQLHCVNGIRFAYVAARDGLFKHPEDLEAAFQHVNHCFDVLRQSLLCKADTTLIPVGPNKQHTRSCRDWNQVREFVDDNQRFWADTPFQLSSHRSGQGYEE